MRNYYILFDSHEQAVQLHSQLRTAGLTSAIAPTPRAITVCCGVALLIREEDIAAVRAYLDTHSCVYRSVESIEQTFNPRRDSYC